VFFCGWTLDWSFSQSAVNDDQVFPIIRLFFFLISLVIWLYKPYISW
jgi:hypothetical protein